MTFRLTVTIRVARSTSRTRSSISSPHRSPLSISVSTSSLVSAEGRALYSTSNCSGVTIVRTVAGTDGIFTPWHGWMAVTWSFSAVVNRAQDRGLAVLDRPRGRPFVLRPGHPLPDVLRHDVDHPHRPEVREEIRVQAGRVLLAGGQLDLVMREPDLLHIRAERLPSLAWVAEPVAPQFRLGVLPGLVRGLLCRPRACRPLLPAQIPVERGPPRPSRVIESLPGEPHAASPSKIVCHRLVINESPDSGTQQVIRPELDIRSTDTILKRFLRTKIRPLKAITPVRIRSGLVTFEPVSGQIFENESHGFTSRENDIRAHTSHRELLDRTSHEICRGRE